MRYLLVVKQEANHGTGLYIYDESWYNPDGSVAAEYPIEASTPEGFSTIKHVASPENGMLQGCIDYYRKQGPNINLRGGRVISITAGYG